MAALNSSRRLKATSSVQNMSNALSFQPAPLTSAALSRSVEEDLESQARSSLSLFGFGTLDSVNWSPVSASAAAAAATTDTPGYQGNLSIKWVVGDKPSRMFASRTTYCLLDYECILVNDWDENADPSPMYVRTMQSCYSPQCQPWLDEVGSKPTDLQPTGFMVRQARGRDGYVEVQFVVSILEKAQLPMAARRAKLRALCAKIARLEEDAVFATQSLGFRAAATIAVCVVKFAALSAVRRWTLHFQT
ncbi:hypothetical protein BBJ29_008395 [Phytophthora kernoviae]|uniref:Uncharacterized protein n=1 Tax=Phytophthora kernoviae TaxID=325452 RepID=A0A3F2RQG5_9STRA|nr:hypothetical protein BBP00_00004882 [Phytophthora kernoviae]RLN64244.1 hypothetical protein BBJ29_008395 [Phytophthora kernoviae]